MYENPRWRAIESPHEWVKLRNSREKWWERCIKVENTEWNRRYREFVMTIITTKKFPPKFPTKDLLMKEAERRTEFILASNPKNLNPMMLDAVLDFLLGQEWRTRNSCSSNSQDGSPS